MLDPRLVPSALVHAADRRVVIREVVPRQRRLGAMFWMLRWLVSLARARSRQRLSGEEIGARVRALAEHFGGLWVKLGQLVSLRVDLFGVAFSGELAKLQDTGTGFPSEVAIAIVEQELGVPIDRVFEWFDPVPFAAASIGQVHRGRLRAGGQPVAVKVQRPGIAEQMTAQLAGIERTAAWAIRLRIAPQVGWRTFAWELREVIREELDYRYEAANIRRMRRTLRRHGVHVPQVYEQHSTARVLVTELVDGVSMIDYIKTRLADPASAQAWLDGNGIDPRKVARRLTLSLLRQIIEDNLFHGDMHPGNIVLLRDNEIALVDFGTVSSTEREYLEKFRAMMFAMATRDFRTVAEITLLMCGGLPPIDLGPVTDDLVRAIEAWTARTFVRDLPFHQKSLNNIYGEISRVLIRHRCVLEWAFLRIRRAQETLDASLLVLFPEGNATELSEDYIGRAERRALRRLRGAAAERVLTAAARAEEVIDDFGDMVPLQLELVRREAQVFASQSGQAASAALILFLCLSAGLLAAGFFGLRWWIGPDLTAGIGALDPQVRLLGALVAAALMGGLVRLGIRLRRAEATSDEAGLAI